MQAIIKTGGKQYLVTENQEIKIETTDFDADKKTLEFSEVLLIADEKNIEIGQPFLKTAKVTGEVVEEFRDKKILIVKHHPKKHYRRTAGHRQNLLKVKITKIEA